MHKPLSKMPPARDAPSGDGRNSNTSASRSEMKRINALNLEPSMQRFEDTPKRRIPPKPVQLSLDHPLGRNQSDAGPANDQQQQPQQSQGQQQQQQQQQQAWDQPQQGKGRSGQTGPTDSASEKGKAKSALNPQAKEFSLNTQAAAFTPSGGGGGGAVAHAQDSLMAKPPPPVQMREFRMGPQTPLLSVTLQMVLDQCFERAKRERPDVAEAWPEAVGPPYRQIFGPPAANGPPMQPAPGSMPGVCMQGQMAPVPAPWQQPPPNQSGGGGGHPGDGQQGGMSGQGGGQMGPPGGVGPQGMMPPQGMQGFTMAGIPGGQPQGMYPPMYFMQGAPGGPGQQQMMQNSGGQQGMQPGFVAVNLPGGQASQGQQPVAFFNPQMMMIPQQMPSQMQGGQGGPGGQDGWNPNNQMGGQMQSFGGPMSQQKGGS